MEKALAGQRGGAGGGERRRRAFVVGLRENNPLLRNSQGGINVRKSVLVKSAASGGFLLLEFFLIKRLRNERLEKPFTIINGAAAGAVATTALRNYRIRRPDSPHSSPGMRIEENWGRSDGAVIFGPVLTRGECRSMFGRRLAAAERQKGVIQTA